MISALLLTSIHEGPEIRITAIPALPGAVDSAKMVSPIAGKLEFPTL